MQRRKSSDITLETYACAVLIRASPHQFCMYQRFPNYAGYQREYHIHSHSAGSTESTYTAP